MEWLGIVRRHALACMSILLVAASMFGQSGTTSVRGVITDQRGASVPNATLTLTSSDIGVTLTTQTDKDGAYQFLEVRPATYSLTVEAPGFATYKQTNLQLLVATPATNNFTMQLAGVATTVEVISTSQTINTTDATIGNAFNQAQISALPFEGRDPAAIRRLARGKCDQRKEPEANSTGKGFRNHWELLVFSFDFFGLLSVLAAAGASFSASIHSSSRW